MQTLQVKAKGRTAKGREAVTALYLLLTQGVSLGCHYTDTELLPEERVIWRPIRKGKEVIGSVSWSYTDNESGEIVRALELGASIQRKGEERRRENVKVIVRG